MCAFLKKSGKNSLKSQKHKENIEIGTNVICWCLPLCFSLGSMGQIWHHFLFVKHVLSATLEIFLLVCENEMLLECLSIIVIFFIHKKTISKYTPLLFRQMNMQENPQGMIHSIKDSDWLCSWSCTLTCFSQIQQLIFSVFCWTLAEWRCVITQSA